MPGNYDWPLAAYHRDDWDVMSDDEKRSVLIEKSVYVFGGSPNSVGKVTGWNLEEVEKFFDVYRPLETQGT